MKLEFQALAGGGPAVAATARGRVTGETRRLHRALRQVLERHGVACRMAPPAAAMPDLCFTRDAAVTTPWGLVLLNPALPHRAAEVDHLAAAADRCGLPPVARISAGTIEGGDVCIVRPGLAIIGCSGERTTPAGAAELAGMFRRRGWEVLVHLYDPHFLHLDTIFCMLDEGHALACVDVLDDGFLAAVAARGITLLPVTYKEARRRGRRAGSSRGCRRGHARPGGRAVRRCGRGWRASG